MTTPEEDAESEGRWWFASRAGRVEGLTRVIKEAEEKGYRQKPVSVHKAYDSDQVAVIRTFETTYDMTVGDTFFIIEHREGSCSCPGDLQDFCLITWSQYSGMRTAFELPASFLS